MMNERNETTFRDHLIQAGASHIIGVSAWYAPAR
jgi:hypothetical protein